VKKEETLRGLGSFAAVLETGERIEGELLRCFFRLERRAGTRVRAGFSISSTRTRSAVKRNRVKRLMRAAFDAEGGRLRSSVVDGSLAIVFVFKGRKGTAVERLGLGPVQSDMASLCRRCAATLPTVTS
jgi:ribonuclease P protein component